MSNKRKKKSQKSEKQKKYLAKKKRRKWKILKKWLLSICVILALLVGIDYFQAGDISRTLAVTKQLVESTGEVVGSVTKPITDFVKNGIGDVTKPIADSVKDTVGNVTKPVTDYVEKAASDLGDAAWKQLESLNGDIADYVAGLIGKSEGNSGQRNVGSLTEIPEYTGEAYVTVNGNIPSFTEEQRTAESYESYSELDSLGRCGYAEAKLSRALMPTEERGKIGSVKPSGWKTIKYSMIDGLYLYNRCHLIGYQLAGENANEKNLITGTRYLNVTGMLPWENLVADYIQETGDEVLYRVTPIYEGENLVAHGVQMEAESLGSEEIKFNIFVFNVQPGISIDYSNGNSWMSRE